jgi:hypothetical protein
LSDDVGGGRLPVVDIVAVNPGGNLFVSGDVLALPARRIRVEEI